VAHPASVGAVAQQPAQRGLGEGLGIRVSEHFPRLAQRAKRYAIIRSMTHDGPAHLSSVHHVLTGRHAPKVNSDDDPPSRKDAPHVGSVLAYLGPAKTGAPFLCYDALDRLSPSGN
jgi:hypothetical protein